MKQTLDQLHNRAKQLLSDLDKLADDIWENEKTEIVKLNSIPDDEYEALRYLAGATQNIISNKDLSNLPN